MIREEDIKNLCEHSLDFNQIITNVYENLKKFGISSFVAHENIEPTKEWLKEIERDT